MTFRFNQAKRTRLLVGLVCLTACASSGCGFYRHHRTADNIVAIGWDADGTPVSLGQVVTYKSGFLGISPDTIDPAYDLGPLVVLRPGGRRTTVAGFDSWWRVQWAVARGVGKGFVLALTKGGPNDPKSVCLLVDNAARTASCPAAVDASSEFAYGVPGTDHVVFWKAVRRNNARAVNLETGESLPAASLPAHAALDGGQGMDLSFAALDPAKWAWAVAFPGRGQRGIWLLEEAAEPRLLVPFPPGTLPPHLVMGRVEDRVRLFPQTYGLAWSPDGKWIYWCGEGPQGLIASTADGSSRQVTPCLTGATWSPDGRRIAGIDENGVLRVWTVQ